MALEQVLPARAPTFGATAARLDALSDRAHLRRDWNTRRNAGLQLEWLDYLQNAPRRLDPWSAQRVLAVLQLELQQYEARQISHLPPQLRRAIKCASHHQVPNLSEDHLHPRW